MGSDISMDKKLKISTITKKSAENGNFQRKNPCFAAWASSEYPY